MIGNSRMGERANDFDRPQVSTLRVCFDESRSPISADVRMALRWVSNNRVDERRQCCARWQGAL